MPVWNTEHWYTAQSDRTVQEQLFNLISGRSKTNLVILGNFFTAGYQSGGYYNPKDEATAPDLIPQPNAAAYNTMAYFLEGQRLVEELSPDRLPYAMLFERGSPTTAAAQHKAVLVLIGTSIHPANQVWTQVRDMPDATLRLPSTSGITGVFDRYGNAIAPQRDGAVVLPFNTEAVYLTADSSDALRRVADELQPQSVPQIVQIGILDPTDDSLIIRITNPMPQDLALAVRVRLGVEGTPVDADSKPLRVDRGKTVDLALPLTAPIPPEGLVVNVIADAGAAGRAERTETVQRRMIARFTPVVDADVEEWVKRKVAFHVVRPAGETSTDAIAAAMPWEVLANQQSADTIGRWAMAYDATHLYIIAQLRTAERADRPWDQTRRDWFELHPGGYAYKTAPKWPFTGESLQLALDIVDNPADAIYPDADPRQRRYPQFRTDYLFGFYETTQGTPQAWQYRRPGGPFRHRYPFSPMLAIDQQIAPGVKVAVRRDGPSRTTTFETAIPLATLPELDARPGAVLRGGEIKLTTRQWAGLYSAADRGAAKADQSVFQPFWMPGYTTEIPWRFE